MAPRWVKPTDTYIVYWNGLPFAGCSKQHQIGRCFYKGVRMLRWLLAWKKIYADLICPQTIMFQSRCIWCWLKNEDKSGATSVPGLACKWDKGTLTTTTQTIAIHRLAVSITKRMVGSRLEGELKALYVVRSSQNHAQRGSSLVVRSVTLALR